MKIEITYDAGMDVWHVSTDNPEGSYEYADLGIASAAVSQLLARQRELAGEMLLDQAARWATREEPTAAEWIMQNGVQQPDGTLLLSDRGAE